MNILKHFLSLLPVVSHLLSNLPTVSGRPHHVQSEDLAQVGSDIGRSREANYNPFYRQVTKNGQRDDRLNDRWTKAFFLGSQEYDNFGFPEMSSSNNHRDDTVPNSGLPLQPSNSRASHNNANSPVRGEAKSYLRSGDAIVELEYDPDMSEAEILQTAEAMGDAIEILRSDYPSEWPHTVQLCKFYKKTVINESPHYLGAYSPSANSTITLTLASNSRTFNCVIQIKKMGPQEEYATTIHEIDHLIGFQQTLGHDSNRGLAEGRARNTEATAVQNKYHDSTLERDSLITAQRLMTSHFPQVYESDSSPQGWYTPQYPNLRQILDPLDYSDNYSIGFAVVRDIKQYNPAGLEQYLGCVSKGTASDECIAIHLEPEFKVVRFKDNLDNYANTYNNILNTTSITTPKPTTAKPTTSKSSTVEEGSYTVLTCKPENNNIKMLRCDKIEIEAYKSISYREEADARLSNHCNTIHPLQKISPGDNILIVGGQRAVEIVADDNRITSISKSSIGIFQQTAQAVESPNGHYKCGAQLVRKGYKLVNKAIARIGINSEQDDCQILQNTLDKIEKQTRDCYVNPLPNALAEDFDSYSQDLTQQSEDSNILGWSDIVEYLI
ncbi:hypothetical protein [Candidatus Tisiphia endosymbiont of Beris chalybata]|uniref:hypothetical protein n=1 Tax=Candidatus Tisiphia endosymbiont of Beris chalybata TaxID=3066262 RepID=UPI00312CAD86